MCLTFPLFLICTIRDEIIWHGECKVPKTRCAYFSKEAPSVNFKLPYFPPVDPQERAIPVENLVQALMVVFWKILTCVPDVEAAVKDL